MGKAEQRLSVCGLVGKDSAFQIMTVGICNRKTGMKVQADIAMWIKMSTKVLCMQRLQKPITGPSEDDWYLNFTPQRQSPKAKGNQLLYSHPGTARTHTVPRDGMRIRLLLCLWRPGRGSVLGGRRPGRGSVLGGRRPGRGSVLGGRLCTRAPLPGSKLFRVFIRDHLPLLSPDGHGWAQRFALCK
uniref:Uncharacterized protein n=1 Tax=Paramormyrops kingsleyae TaxID=1676925 RepID=A0A3B3RJC0_9TELE